MTDIKSGESVPYLDVHARIAQRSHVRLGQLKQPETIAGDRFLVVGKHADDLACIERYGRRRFRFLNSGTLAELAGGRTRQCVVVPEQERPSAGHDCSMTR